VKIREIQLHNYRSIQDETIGIGDYCLLIGANNSGKTNVLDALRTFYDLEKFDGSRDSPKFPTADRETWIEVEYELSDAEVGTIKAEYLRGAKRFRVRKWLHPPDKDKQGIFGYENGKLSGNLFYGWKNVAQGKLGDVIHVPAVSRLEEQTKLSGPSPLRDLINGILKPIIASSESFRKLEGAFEEFGQKIKDEETADNRSLAELERRINNEIERWGSTFSLEVVPPQQDEIVKNLIQHKITDSDLKIPMESGSFGHGFQRHLIFTLIRVASDYVEPKPEPKKKEFSPELRLLLFEEPEAYLHPPQQEILDRSLRTLAKMPGSQVIAATHSPLFVSRNTDDIANLIRLSKVGPKTQVGQATRDKLNQLFEENVAEMKLVNGAGGGNSAAEEDDMNPASALEATRHFLWLNPDRCNMFFADLVVIVEGLSEQVLTNYWVKTGQMKDPGRGVYVLESSGKFNIPRFMKLCTEMKIAHSVMYDEDRDKAGKKKEVHQKVADLIKQSQSSYTVKIETIPTCLERYLGLDIEKKDRWKAAKLLLAAQRDQIDPAKLAEFKAKLESLLAL